MFKRKVLLEQSKTCSFRPVSSSYTTYSGLEGGCEVKTVPPIFTVIPLLNMQVLFSHHV